MPQYYYQQNYMNAATNGTGNDLWGCWNQQYVTASSSQNVIYTVANIWAAWNQNYPTIYTYQTAQPSAEAAEQQAAREASEKRAEELLFLFLTPEQRTEYKSKGYFETSVNDTRYRISKGRAGNVHKIDATGKATVRMCVHPTEWLPDDDNVLAQFLALHTDAAQLERTANHTRLG